MRVLRPKSLAEALAAMAAEPGKLTPIAGGTDVMVSWHHRPKGDLALLDLSLVSELRGLRWTPESLELGALATYWDAIDSAEVRGEFPLLVRAALEVGAIQIQTRGTWAGNIANGSPAADGVPALMASDAVVVLESSAGREEVPLGGYFTGYKRSARKPDQLITAIRVPRRKNALEYWHKVGSRSAQAITKVGVAMTRSAAGWRVAANSVAPFVTRCRALEAELESGRAFGSPAEVAEVLKRDVAPIDDIRSTAAYRLKVLSRVIYYRLAEPAAA